MAGGCSCSLTVFLASRVCFQLNIMGEKPFLMGPLASIASFLSVTSPGPVDDEQAPEDIFSVWWVAEHTHICDTGKGRSCGLRLLSMACMSAGCGADLCSEETALLGGPFADTPMDRNARKRYFSVQEHLANHYFETDLVYGECGGPSPDVTRLDIHSLPAGSTS